MTTSTNVERRRVRARRALLCATSLVCAAVSWPTPAHAQTVAPAPARTAVDTNNVDLFTGLLIVHGPSIGMGQGDQGLSYAYENWGTGFADSVGGALNQSGGVATVSIGSFTDDFTISGTTFTSVQAQGATLTLAGGIYTYISSGGTVAHFDSGKTLTVPYFGSMGMLIDVTSAAGIRRTYSYDHVNGCLHMTGSRCTVHQSYYRLASITNSFGYRIGLLYNEMVYDESTSADPVGDFALWKTLDQVELVNLESGSSPTLTLQGGGTSSFVVTDPMGRATTYRMAGPQVAGVTYPGSGSENVTATYSGGRVATLATAAGTWSYAATDNAGANTRTVVVTDPASHATTYVFDLTTQRMTAMTDALGRTTAWQYDTSARPTRVTAPEGNYTQYTYDARGNVTETRLVAKPGSGVSDIVTSAVYPGSCASAVTCNKPTSTTDARGNTTDYSYASTHGGVLSVTAPAPAAGGTRPQVRAGYTGYTDYFGSTVYLPTATSTCRTGASCAGTADEIVSSTGYGSLAANNLLPVSRSAGAGDGSLVATASVGYDAVGNVVAATDPLGAVTGFSYDADRERTLAVSPDPDGAGALKSRAVKSSYNADGTVASVEAGTANADGTGFASLQQVNTTYDSALRKTSDTLTAGGTTYRVTQYSYDAAGRLECTALRMNGSAWGSLPSSACTAQTVGSYGPDRIVKTTYDAAGQATKVQSAYGISGTQADEATATYNANGTTASVTDAEGNRTSYSYDGVDRLVKTTYPSTTKGAGTSNASDYEQLGYDAGGNVTSRRLRDGVSLGYSYDALNRLTQRTVPSNSNPDDTSVSYTYDLLGRPLLAAKNADNQTAFTWDALGRRTGESNYYYAITNSYDLAGRRTRLAWHDGFYVDYDYDATGSMTAVRENGATSGVGVLATYAYDDLGRRTTLTRGNGVTTSYGYDAVSRLTSLANDLSGSTSDVTTTLAYNPAGQITSTTRSNDAYAWTGAANVNRGYTTNGLNQVTASGGTSLGYDARGNLNSSGSASYTYTSGNQLTYAGSNTYYTDSLDRMDYIGPEGMLIGHDGDEAVAEMAFTTCCSTRLAITRRYVYGAGTDEPLVWYEGAGTSDRRWLVADERGSVVAVTDASGAATAINSYDEYGIPGSGNIGRFQYTGQAWIPSLGLYYYKARLYAPTLGRFLQTDPIGYGDGMNWYNYVGSDPVNATDPSGLRDPIQGTPPGGCKDAAPEVAAQYRGCDIVVNGSSGGIYISQFEFNTRFGGGNLGGPNPVYGTNSPFDNGAISATRSKTTPPASGKPQSHNYRIRVPTLCSPSQSFNDLKEPGMSAPGSPQAKEGTTPNIQLWGNGGKNVITQIVNSKAMTITNITQQGHQFYPGSVTFQVIPEAGNTSDILVTGTGTGPNPIENDVVGLAFFGFVANSVAQVCSARAGIPTGF